MFDLGTLGGTYSEARAVNDAGQVAGVSHVVGDAALHSFFWSSATGMVDLGALASPIDFVGIDSSGMVAWNVELAPGAYRALVWTAPGGIVDLGSLGGALTYAKAVSGAGVVVGQSSLADGSVHAFAWTASGGMIDLGTLGGLNAVALAVSDDGHVAGQAETGGEHHAFSWTAAGGMVDAGTLGGVLAIPTSVSDAGQIVGGSYVATNDTSHAFSWTADGGMVDLGTLGGAWSCAYGVNGGLVIGFSMMNDGGSHAFAWSDSTGMIDLGTLGGVGSYAAAVNDAGQIAGNVRLSWGAARAVLWEPQAPAIPGLVADIWRWLADGAIDNWGVANGLVVKLEGAQTALNADDPATATARLNDAIALAEAQSGRHIESHVATQIVTVLQQLLAEVS